MSPDEIIAAIEDGGKTPPGHLSAPLQALWTARAGDWEGAHQIAQDAGGHDGDWVHAYLHRVEGDEGNAAYWYARAGESQPDCSLEREWRQLVEALG
ncbi:MAG: hypothetical protein AAGK14_03105 [Verrucomicrobiota bacterium]